MQQVVIVFIILFSGLYISCVINNFPNVLKVKDWFHEEQPKYQFISGILPREMYGDKGEEKGDID